MGCTACKKRGPYEARCTRLVAPSPAPRPCARRCSAAPRSAVAFVGGAGLWLFWGAVGAVAFAGPVWGAVFQPAAFRHRIVAGQCAVCRRGDRAGQVQPHLVCGTNGAEPAVCRANAVAVGIFARVCQRPLGVDCGQLAGVSTGPGRWVAHRLAGADCGLPGQLDAVLFTPVAAHGGAPFCYRQCHALGADVAAPHPVAGRAVGGMGPL